HGGRLLGNWIRPLAVGRGTGLSWIEHVAIYRGLFVASAPELLKVRRRQSMILGKWHGPLMVWFGRAPAPRGGMARTADGAPAMSNKDLLRAHGHRDSHGHVVHRSCCGRSKRGSPAHADQA